MSSSRTSTPRGRYREQVFAEIKEHAWRQIAESGVAALSLNAIARQMGISGPALYRYFDSRNALVNVLVADAYRMVHDTVRAAVADRGNTPNVVAHAVRDWALAHPHRYFLIFGTPLPDYHAPVEMTDLARNVMALILNAVASANGASSEVGEGGASGPAAVLDAHLADHRAWTENVPVPVDVARVGLTLWTRLHGVLSLELAGHFDGMGFDPAVLFQAEVDSAVG